MKQLKSDIDYIKALLLLCTQCTPASERSCRRAKFSHMHVFSCAQNNARKVKPYPKSIYALRACQGTETGGGHTCGWSVSFHNPARRAGRPREGENSPISANAFSTLSNKLERSTIESQLSSLFSFFTYPRGYSIYLWANKFKNIPTPPPA